MGQSGDPTLVAWFRPDVRREVWRAWLRAFLFVVVAMMVLTIPLGFDVPSPGLQVATWILGGALLVAGPASLLWRLSRVLGPEITLSLHTDGVRYASPSLARSVSWEEIATVRPRDEGDGLIITTEAGTELVITWRFLGASTEELVALILELQQKALLGLPVRPRTPPDAAPRGRARD